MNKIFKLTKTELIKIVADLKIGESIDFATNCAFLDKDLDKANESDLTNWYGVKKISEFDQEIILIGGYGGDRSFAVSYKWDNEPSEAFEYDMEIALDNISAHENGADIYVIGEVVDTKNVDSNDPYFLGGYDWGFDTSIADTVILLDEIDS